MKHLSVPLMKGGVASWLVRLTPERAVRVQTLVGDIAFCSWALCFPPPRVYKWVPANSWGKLTKLICGGVTCDGLTSRPGEVEILLAASCYRNRDKAPAATNPSDSKASLLFKPNNVNDVDAHFEVYSKFIALKSNQGFSVR